MRKAIVLDDHLVPAPLGIDRAPLAALVAALGDAAAPRALPSALNRFARAHPLRLPVDVLADVILLATAGAGFSHGDAPDVLTLILDGAASAAPARFVTEII